MADGRAVTTETAGDLIESVIVKGDLAKLSPAERTRYYVEVCKSVGLNPLTKPLEFLVLNGKLVLYARRDASDQLRKINGVSVEIVSRSIEDGLLTVHVRAKDAIGRTDEDLGVVNVNGLKGEAAANAILKGVTKAKRRVTLSICGLGLLDETEVEDIPASAKAPIRDVTPPKEAPAITPKPVTPPHDPETGEVKPHAIPINGTWREWGAEMIAAVKSAPSMDVLADWISANNETYTKMTAESPKAAGSVQKAIDEAYGKFDVPAEDAELLPLMP